MKCTEMEAILKAISLEPMDLTYLGIGSSPHLSNDQTLDAKHDQLIPLCFHDFILKEKKSMRILHFDPHFDSQWEFLHKYFEGWNLLPMEFPGGKSWVSDTLEVIVLPQNLEHEDHYWFFEHMTETILNTKGKLAIQEYTGYELQPLQQKLYQATSQKEKFKRRILLDMSYGTDLGCCTDMTKLQPFYEYNGDFLNLQYLTEDTAKRYIGVSLALDERFKQKYRALFLQTLNHMHVDYRRKLKGESVMYGDSRYTETSSPDEIMDILQQTLRKIIEVLIPLRVLSEQSQEKLESLFASYKEHDPYKWYGYVSNVLP
jgi:hypothetical protein